MKAGGKTTMLHFRVPKVVREELCAMAEREGVSISALARRIFSGWMERHGSAPVQRPDSDMHVVVSWGFRSDVEKAARARGLPINVLCMTVFSGWYQMRRKRKEEGTGK